MKTIYIKTVRSNYRTSGYALLLDINNGCGWRRTSFGSWAVMFAWMRENVGADVRIFVSGR